MTWTTSISKIGLGGDPEACDAAGCSQSAAFAFVAIATGLPTRRRVRCAQHAEQLAEDIGQPLPIAKREPHRFEIPDGTPMATCEAAECRANIRWIVTASGKRMPVNPDGTSHFSSCPAAETFRKKRR